MAASRTSLNAGASAKRSMGHDTNRLRASVGNPQSAGDKAERAGSFLLGAMLVWCVLLPEDAVSVFIGAALPQNLGWLLTAVVVAAGVGLSQVGTQISKRQTVIALSMLSWLVVVSVMAGRGSNPRVAWFGFWQVISIAACYYIGRGQMVGPRCRSVLLAILIAGGIAVAFHGIYQSQVSFPSERAQYLADPEKVLRESEIDAPAGSVIRAQLENRYLNSQEPFASFALANSLAVYLTASLILCIGLWPPGSKTQGSTAGDHVPQAGQRRAWRLILLACMAGLLFTTWFLTKSRTAYVGLAMGLIYWAGLIRLKDSSPELRQRMRGVFAGMLVLFAGCLVWFLRNDRLVLSESLYSLRFRLDYWYGTAGILWEHWLFGTGLGNFQAYYPAFKLETASETVADPHNWLLDIAASLSAPIALGILIWLADLLLPKHQAEPASDQAELADCDASLARSLGWGAGAGGLCIAAFAFLLGEVDGLATLLGWSLGAAAVVGLWPLICRLATASPFAFKAAAVSMIVCLLASGSWQASGLAMPLVLLLAASEPVQRRDTGSGAGRWLPVSIAGFGLLVFIFQSWLPVTRAWALRQEIVVAGSMDERLRLVDEALAADPLDAAGLSMRAQTLVLLAQQSRADEFPARAVAAQAAIDDWLAADAQNFNHWTLAGQLGLDLAATATQTGQPALKWLSLAAEYYAQAAVRYPSSVGLQVQCAVVNQLSDRPELAQAYLKEAQRLSQQTPHADKMLNMQQIYLPRSLLDVASAELLQPTPEGTVEAELAETWLRIPQDRQ